jgi:hypothetical protein
VLHDDAFFGAGTGGVCEGLVGLGFSKWSASGLGLGGIRISCAHLANEVLEARTNVPIPLGGGFVERDAPFDSATADQFLGHFTLRRQVEFGAYDDDWYRLGEKTGGETVGGGRGRAEEALTRSSPLRWYIRCRMSSISRRLVSWVRLCILVSDATRPRGVGRTPEDEDESVGGLENVKVSASRSRAAMMRRERALIYFSFSVWNWSAPAVSRISSWRAWISQSRRFLEKTHGTVCAVDLARALVDF